jgi:hypothetical protein
MTPG